MIAIQRGRPSLAGALCRGLLVVLLVGLLLMLGLPGVALAQSPGPEGNTPGQVSTNVSGDITTNTTWTLANKGPSSKALVNKSVEGWAFQNGSKGGRPRASASFATLTKR